MVEKWALELDRGFPMRVLSTSYAGCGVVIALGLHSLLCHEDNNLTHSSPRINGSVHNIHRIWLSLYKIIQVLVSDYLGVCKIQNRNFPILILYFF